MLKHSFLISLPIAILTTSLLVQRNANAQRVQCPANPTFGTQCTEIVSIRLRKLQSEGRDEFNRRYEPNPGWVVDSCDTRSGELGRTGEVSGPNCIKVQTGNKLTSSGFIESQVRHFDEHMAKLKLQFGNLPIFADIQSKAQNEFSSAQKNLQSTQTQNSGADISAWVAVEGGCHVREPFTGSCISWGPGGSLNTDLIIHLRYVGTDQDISQITQKYITQANDAARNAPTVSACELVFKAGQDLTAPHTDQAGRVWGGKIKINSEFDGLFDDGLNRSPITVFIDQNDRNQFKFVRDFGNDAKQVWQGRCTPPSATGTWSNNFNDGRGTFVIKPN